MDICCDSQKESNCRRARLIFFAGGAYLVAMYAIVAIVDVFDIGGLRTVLGRDDGMPLWFHIFGEAMPTEWLQWCALGAAGLVSANAAGIAYVKDESRLATFLSIMSFAFVLMLIEDAGNPSHAQALLLQQVLGESSIIRHGGRLPMFLLVAAVPLYAIFKYWSEMQRFGYERSVYVFGISAYAIAAISSVPMNLLFSFYDRVGSWFLSTILSDRMLPLRNDYFGRDGSIFMDFVYEESIELIGATVLLAASLNMLCRATAIPAKTSFS